MKASGSQSVHTRLGDLVVRVVGSGPPAVLWHSLYVDSTTWQRVESPLAAERRLILIDGPGHGGNKRAPRDYDLEDCADAASDVLDALAVDEPVDWLGNAWGGHVGTVFAARKPERCRSVVSVAAPVQALEPEIRRKTRTAVPVYRALGAVGPLVRMIAGALLGACADQEDVRIVGDALRRADRRGLVQAIQCISLDREDLGPLLPHVTTPTLLVAASDDMLWGFDQAGAAARRLPVGAAVELPGGGHVAPLLHSAPALAETVTQFWRAPAARVETLRQQRVIDPVR